MLGSLIISDQTKCSVAPDVLGRIEDCLPVFVGPSFLVECDAHLFSPDKDTPGFAVIRVSQGTRDLVNSCLSVLEGNHGEHGLNEITLEGVGDVLYFCDDGFFDECLHMNPSLHVQEDGFYLKAEDDGTGITSEKVMFHQELAMKILFHSKEESPELDDGPSASM